LKISKIFLYDEPSVPEININQLADFIKKNFAIDIEVRKNIFSNVKKLLPSNLHHVESLTLESRLNFIPLAQKRLNLKKIVFKTPQK